MCNPISSWLKASILFLALSASTAGALAAQQQTNGGATKATGATKANRSTKATGATNITKARKTRPLPISKAARLALKQATAVAATARGLKGDARSTALTAGAKAFEAVAAKFQSEAGAGAKAWFSAAELWRRNRSLDAATRAYGLAVQCDPYYQERAWLQLAHIHRRQKQLDAALELYKKVARLKSGTARTHQARMWIGRCFEAQKKPDLATDAYRQALSLTTKPRRVVDVCNRLALCLVRQGKLDQAAAVIRQAETTAAPTLAKKDKLAKSLSRALDRMSAKKALTRARDKATGAHRDAQALERHK